MSDALVKEQQISNKQYDAAEIVTARVVANYGDPGVDEDYYFDILSRYVIVMIESINRIPTNDKNQQLFALVKRPSHLWINSQITIPASGLVVSDLRRADALNNVNVGSAQSYAVKSIPKINFPYTLGEKISIRRLKDEVRLQDTSLFGSAFHKSYLSVNSQYSSSYYNEGLPKPYIDSSREPYTKLKSIRSAQDAGIGAYVYPVNGGSGSFQTANAYTFHMAINKYQFELFWLHTHTGTSSDNALKIFNGQNQNGSLSQLARQNGYYFSSKSQMGFSTCAYEDINVGGKRREPTSDCMPLIVTTPNTFPTPSRREIGTILYDPTYEVIQQNE